MTFKELRLRADLCAAVEEKLLRRSEMSVEDLVAFVLEELLRSSSELDVEEERLLEDRLRGLGYL